MPGQDRPASNCPLVHWKIFLAFIQHSTAMGESHHDNEKVEIKKKSGH